MDLRTLSFWQYHKKTLHLEKIFCKSEVVSLWLRAGLEPYYLEDCCISVHYDCVPDTLERIITVWFWKCAIVSDCNKWAGNPDASGPFPQRHLFCSPRECSSTHSLTCTLFPWWMLLFAYVSSHDASYCCDFSPTVDAIGKLPRTLEIVRLTCNEVHKTCAFSLLSQKPVS